MDEPIMKPMCEVLSSGYSYHTKKFFVSCREGVAFYVIRLQTEGMSHTYIDGKLQPFSSGDILLLKPGDPYELSIEASPSGDYFLFCQGEWIDAWWQRSAKPKKTKIPLHEGVLTFWRQLNLELAKHNQKNKEMLDYYLRILCLQIERHILEQAAHPDGSHAYLAYRIKHYIEVHATSPFMLEQVAQSIGLSISRTVSLFKAVFGHSIMQHAIEVRLAIAKERILYSSFTLEQIAESCGYASYSYFHRMFRAHFGISPRDFRSRGH